MVSVLVFFGREQVLKLLSKVLSWVYLWPNADIIRHQRRSFS
jgi:hypothetical protein